MTNKLVCMVLALTLLLTVSVCSCSRNLAGGWNKASDKTITPELQAYFDQAMTEQVGSTYVAKELVATQVVAGMNYKFLCDVTPVVPNAKTTEKYVIVYVDLDQHASLLEIQDK